MQLLSPDFKEGDFIPKKYSCDGDNLSPDFEVHGIPEGTTCLALIMEDPDARKRTFVHWVMWNMSFKTEEFSSKELPGSAIEGLNSAEKSGYIGPCPPSGTHRYFFKLFALDTSMSLAPESTSQDLETAMQGHIVAQTELVGMYTKQVQ
jgi:Raf kinase inhibitor-like YbhB/YbcL family protein